MLEALDSVPVPPDAERIHDPATPEGTLRRRNLLQYLRAVHAVRPTRLLVGEAPGWRGMTITGVPFLAVRDLRARPGLVTGHPDGDGFELPTDPAVEWEAAARDFWAALASLPGPVPLVWPAYPHHPFMPGRPQSNRPPRPAEVRAGIPVLTALRAAFDDPPVVAVGRVAQRSLALAGIEAPVVRHPARGGARAFAEQLAALGS